MHKDYEIIKYNLLDGVGSFYSTIKLSSKIDYEPSTGYLYVKDAILGNIGINIYKGYELGLSNKNAIVKVHRLPEDVFDEASLKSLIGKPVTLQHPNVMVDSRNAKDYVKGSILGEPRIDGENIICDLVIYDKELIDLIAPEDENGERRLSHDFKDLSLGYTAKLEKIENTNEYKQTEIEYNHVAVVKEGRQKNATIVFDSKNNEIRKEFQMEVKEKELQEKEVQEKITDKEEDKEKEQKDSLIEKEEREKEKKEVEDKKELKDKAYFDKKFKEALQLPEGSYKRDLLDSLNAEYDELFGKKQVKDSQSTITNVQSGIYIKPVNNDDVINQHLSLRDAEVKEIDYELLEEESKAYYDKISNPESSYHENYEAFEKFYKNEVRKGKPKLHLQ